MLTGVMIRQISKVSRTAICAALRLAALLIAVAQPVCASDAPSIFVRAHTTFQRLLDANGIDLSMPARGKAIVVNVPAFELLAIEDGRVVFRSRTIVGTPWTRTPLVDTHVTSVRFRPTWRPTPSMMASGEYQDWIRPPGPDNPLGLAAIRLEPPLLVYLHDTNRPELFDEKDRALSHGCIRVDRWEDLVGWILDISPNEVYSRAHGRITRDDPAPKIPVLIRYYTRFPDASGRLRTYPDIYRLALGQVAPEAAHCALE